MSNPQSPLGVCVADHTDHTDSDDSSRSHDSSSSLPPMSPLIKDLDSSSQKDQLNKKLLGTFGHWRMPLQREPNGPPPRFVYLVDHQSTVLPNARWNSPTPETANPGVSSPTQFTQQRPRFLHPSISNIRLPIMCVDQTHHHLKRSNDEMNRTIEELTVIITAQRRRIADLEVALKHQ
jgi:hypothetical protein